MDRRSALAAAAVVLVALAGCSAAGSLDMRPATDDATLADLASRPATLPEEGPTRDRQVVERAIENGSTTARSRRPLVDPGLPFAHEGGYYNVSWTVVDTHPGTSAEVAVDYNGTAPSDETVAYEDLSARDREVLGGLLPPETERRTEGFDVGVVATYNATERNRSVLLAGEYEAVRYEGETYPVSLEDTEPVTIRTYRYSASTVADDAAEYAALLRERYLFTLSGLSDDERAVVEEAVESSYYAEDDDDEAFRSVLETFRRHRAIREGEYDGLWLVRYDGEVYVADLSYGGFEEA
ncbi:MAG: hypothetical protein ABEJ04_04020 [Halobacteriaceae archaeon]